MTIKELEKEIQDVYLLNDKGIIKIVLASVIANRLGLSSKPVWLLILAGSSSGKTAILQTLDKIGDWIFPIDTLTTNTFASGLARSEEVSLLHKANEGVLIFKDFTTITSMNEQGLQEIMGQLRAIYDGSFEKKTGNGKDVSWNGTVGIIAGGTIASQRKMRQFSEQGERFINYILQVPDAKDMTRRAIKNQKNLKDKEAHLANIVRDFVNDKLIAFEARDYDIPEDITNEMIAVADFCTLARSPVTVDPKNGNVIFVGDREMPSRMAIMLTNIAVALMIISDEKELSVDNALIIYKTAMDSIPVDRRMVLRLLAKYDGSTTKNLAVKLNYPTEPVRSWCNQLNARGIIVRTGISGTSDLWKLKDEYRAIVQKYENITPERGNLEPTEEELMHSGLDSREDSSYEMYVDADERILGNIDFELEKDEKINAGILFDEL